MRKVNMIVPMDGSITLFQKSNQHLLHVFLLDVGPQITAEALEIVIIIDKRSVIVDLGSYYYIDESRHLIYPQFLM